MAARLVLPLLCRAPWQSNGAGHLGQFRAFSSAGLASSTRLRLLRVLGLSQNTSASVSEVKAAFRLKAKALHPDVMGTLPAQASMSQFTEVKSAYESLLADMAPTTPSLTTTRTPSSPEFGRQESNSSRHADFGHEDSVDFVHNAYLSHIDDDHMEELVKEINAMFDSGMDEHPGEQMGDGGMWYIASMLKMQAEAKLQLNASASDGNDSYSSSLAVAATIRPTVVGGEAATTGTDLRARPRGSKRKAKR
jgi:hypothetical protein